MTTHLLFDFFGTLVDYSPSRSEQGYPESYQVFRSAGGELDYARFIAHWGEVSERLDAEAATTHREFSMLELGQAFLESAAPHGDAARVVPQLVDAYLREWNKGVRYLPELPEMLAVLAARFDLSIITNTHDPALVPSHLSAMGVDHLFSQVVTSVELGVRKPSGAIFAHALERLGIAAEDAVYVGDSYLHDFQGALGSGLCALLIDPQERAPVPADARLASIFDLEAALAGV